MELTPALCRAQETAQRERAANAILDNVRVIAEKAAVAWGREAVAAENRVARKARALAIAEMSSLQKMRTEDEDDGEQSTY